MRLNFGCGSKKLEGYINIDNDLSIKPDFLMDLDQYPYPFKDHSIKEINLDNVIEHLHTPIDRFFNECSRIMARNAVLTIITPNPFRWKAQYHYLLGYLDDADGWEYNHSLLIRPSQMQALLRAKGFSINPRAGWIEDLTWIENRFTARKREDV